MKDAPLPGSAIQYAYLWARERASGSREGRKDRPVLVVALVVSEREGTSRVLVLAITHVRPAGPEDAVVLPARVKKQLRLDDKPSWIITTEANAFTWPGPDIRPIPGRRPLTSTHGRIPARLPQQIAQS